jgi:hypothetical protein
MNFQFIPINMKRIFAISFNIAAMLVRRVFAARSQAHSRSCAAHPGVYGAMNLDAHYQYSGRTRGGDRVYFSPIEAGDDFPPYIFLGVILGRDAEGACLYFDMWDIDGRWSEEDGGHPWDLMFDM